jgi:hypothetical protein
MPVVKARLDGSDICVEIVKTSHPELFSGAEWITLPSYDPVNTYLKHWNGTSWDDTSGAVAWRSGLASAATSEQSACLEAARNAIGAASSAGQAFDGQYSSLAGVPSSFNPSSHTHPPSEITGTAVVENDSRLSDARPPTAHAHSPSDITGTAVVDNDSRLSDARTPTAHGHAIGDVTGLQTSLDGKASSSHSHAQSDVTGLVTALSAKQETSQKGAANGYASLGADGKVPSAQLPAAGSDPWTYVRVTSDHSTTATAAGDVLVAPGGAALGFTPAANSRYEVEGTLMIRTATATVNPRVGLAWSTGLSDGVATIDTAQTATSQLTTRGNIAASLLAAVGGIPNTTQSWPVAVMATVIAGASPSGLTRIQLASETSGTAVRVMAGSWIKYRIIP